MVSIDMRTLFLVCTITTAVMTSYLIFMRNNSGEFKKGLTVFVIGMLLMLSGYIGVMLQGIISPVFSIVISNTLVIIALNVNLWGLYLIFNEKMKPYLWVFAVLISGILFIILLYYGIFKPSMSVRCISIQVAYIAIAIMSLRLLLKKRNKRRRAMNLVVLSYFIIITASVMRIHIEFLIPLEGAFLDAGGLIPLTVLMYTISITAWPIGIALFISDENRNIAIQKNIENEALVKEIFHRANNNMQIVSSLLELERNLTESSETRKKLMDIAARLEMMSLAHQRLYQLNNTSYIAVRDYIYDLVSYFKGRYFEYKINMKIDIDDFSINIDKAVPLGLVIYEILSNSLQHAFPERRGTIEMSVTQDDEQVVRVEMADNGVGVSDDFNPYTTGSLGLQIITGVIESQLSGGFEIETESGLAYKIKFKNDDVFNRLV